MTTTLDRPTHTRSVRSALAQLGEAPATAVGVIWGATAAMSVFAPDMVTGSQQDHLPIAVLTAWAWGLVASAYVLMATRRRGSGAGLVAEVSIVWIAVMVAVLWTPVMVTGTDPTRIPIAVFVAPVVGALATGFLALHHATHDGSRTSSSGR